jgi:hypothetical protein
MADVVASAVSAWMAGDEEAKGDLEEAMAQLRAKRGGSPDFEAGLAVLEKMTDTVGRLVESLNKLRANVSVSSMLADFKATSQALEEMKRAAAEGGKGSIEDMLFGAILSRFFPGFSQLSAAKRTGAGKVRKLGEEEEAAE